MKRAIALIAALALTTPAGAKMLGIVNDKAVAIIVDAKGIPVGKATVTESKKHGLRVKVSVRGQTRGEHAVHLHSIGACEGPKFASAGPHWNPLARQHGRDNPDGAHQGDLPNMLVGKRGRGSLSFDVPDAKLDGRGEPLIDRDGAAVVIHAMSDDHRTDPAGNSGDRIACGVFREK